MGKQFMSRDKDKMQKPGVVFTPMGALLKLGAPAAKAQEHHGIAHIADWKQLTGVLLTLMFLTFVTVAVTWFDFGAFNLIIAMVIALIKASLVVLFFMHLLYDKPVNALVLIGALLFVMLFVDFALLDTTQYHPSQIPGYYNPDPAQVQKSEAGNVGKEPVVKP